jgi:hypothetical protein
VVPDARHHEGDVPGPGEITQEDAVVVTLGPIEEELTSATHQILEQGTAFGIPRRLGGRQIGPSPCDVFSRSEPVEWIARHHRQTRPLPPPAPPTLTETIAVR